METNSSQITYKMLPFGGLMVVLGTVLIFIVIGQLIAMPLITMLTGIGLAQVGDLAQNPYNYPNAWLALMCLQGITAAIGMILSSIFYWKWIERQPLQVFFQNDHLSLIMFILVVGLILCFVPFDGWIAEWNENIVLPDSLKALEIWMKNKETELKQLTEFLTNFSGIDKLLLGLLVVAAIPAIGEELLFRGLILNLLSRIFANKHIAIWLTAIVFSAIHLQFLGFFPRMLLGAMFGYLFIWTKSLWLPIVAHFVNNGVALLAMYMHNNHISQFDPEEDITVPLPIALLFGGVSMLLMGLISRMAHRVR
jgi:uncharacterized protein